MNKQLFLAALLTLAAAPLALPAADACINNCQLPVGACANPDHCSGSHDACVYGFSWVPLCADVPCVSECFAPVPASGPGQCMQVYREYWIGPGTGVVMRDSCHTQVWVAGYEVHDLLA